MSTTLPLALARNFSLQAKRSVRRHVGQCQVIGGVAVDVTTKGMRAPLGGGPCGGARQRRPTRATAAWVGARRVVDRRRRNVSGWAWSARRGRHASADGRRPPIVL